MARQDKVAETLAKEYMEEKAPVLAELHDAFAVESRFNESKRRYEARDNLQEFVTALDEFVHQEGSIVPFNPFDCPWSEVVAQLERATVATRKSEQGDSHWFTKRRRKLANMTKMVEPLLDAIPDDFCYIHGALALVFHLVQTREQARKDIIDVFADLPEVLSLGYSNAKFFDEDRALENDLHELKMTLFDAIPKLIHILEPVSKWTKLFVPFRSLKAEDLLGSIRKKCSKIEARARKLQGEVIFDISKCTESIFEISESTREHVHMIGDQYRDIGGQYNNIGVQYKDIGNQYKSIDDRIFHLQRTVDQQLSDALSGQNNMFQMLKEVVNVFLYKKQEFVTATAALPMLPAPEISSAEKQEMLLEILDVWDGNEAHDLSTVLKQSQEYDLRSKSHGAMILSSAPFQRWLVSDTSDIIYVEGQLDSSNFGKTSPVSYFCANLAEVFRMADSAIVLRFFCGQHVASNDSLCGPRGLIRSLLAQLIRFGSSASLDELQLDDFQGTHESIEFEDLCHLLLILLTGFPIHCTIFCIIDGVSHLEKDRWSDEYCHFWYFLSHILDSSGSNMRLKVLVTSPTKSRYLQENIRRESQIKVTDRGSTMGHGRQDYLWEAARNSGSRLRS